MIDNKDIARRSAAAWEVKDKWRSVLEECYEYALAGVNPYVSDKKAPRVMNRQFDSTTPNGVMKLANRLLSDLTPPHDDWIYIEPGPVLEASQPKSQLEALQKELDSVARIANMVANQGELVSARGAAFLDLIIAGMGVLLNLEDPENDIAVVSSQCVSQAEVAIEKDAKGRLCGVYRKRSIKVSQIKSQWPDAEIPSEITSMQGKNKDAEIELMEATYKNESRLRGQNIPPWQYLVLFSPSGRDPVELVRRGYNENPWTILQWIVLPGSYYGPGPVLFALPDIRVSNKIVEMMLQNAALALSGTYLVRDDGVVNPDNIQITQGAMIPVGTTGGPLGASIVPLETGRNFDLSELLKGEYQMRIKKWLFDNGLPPLDGSPRSAAEIINRVRELTQDLGAGIGRLSGDLVDYVRRIVGILVRSGVVPFDIKLDQFTLKVQINSPLARAQQLQKVETVINWLQMVLSIGGEQALQIVAKLPETLAWIGDQMGVPSELMNDENERRAAMDSTADVIAAGAAPELAAGGLAA